MQKKKRIKTKNYSCTKTEIMTWHTFKFITWESFCNDLSIIFFFLIHNCFVTYAHIGALHGLCFLLSMSMTWVSISVHDYIHVNFLATSILAMDLNIHVPCKALVRIHFSLQIVKVLRRRRVLSNTLHLFERAFSSKN